MASTTPIQTRAEFESPRGGTRAFYGAVARLVFRAAAVGAWVGTALSTTLQVVNRDLRPLDAFLMFTGAVIGWAAWRESHRKDPRTIALLIALLALTIGQAMISQQFNAVAMLVPILVIGMIASFTLPDRHLTVFVVVFAGGVAAAIGSYLIRFGGDQIIARGISNVLLSIVVGGLMLRLVRRETQRFVRRYQTLFDEVSIGLVRIAHGGDLIAANRSLTRMLGLENDDALDGMRAQDFTYPGELRKAFEEIMDSGQATLRMKRIDGSPIWVRTKLRELKGTSGEVFGYEGFVEDVTDFRRAVATAREAERRFITAFDSAPIGMVLVDQTGSLLRGNHAFADLVGTTVDDLHGNRWDDLVEGSLGQSDAFFSGGSGEGEDLRLPSTPTAQPRWVRVRWNAVESSNGYDPYAIVQVADTTAQHELASFLREQVRSKNDFIASVSHELRTPLTAVLGFSDELEHSLDGAPDEAREMLEIIRAQSMSLSHIVEDLLAAARAEIGELTIAMEPVDVCATLQRIVRSTRHVVEEFGASVTVACGATDAIGDPMRIEQIIRNLVTNAAIHGGPRIEVSARANDGDVVIEVSDNGSGVPPGAESTIFDAYHSLGRDAGLVRSIGLGLSVSSALAKLMDGSLDYRREDGTTVFSLSLHRS